MGNSVKSKNVIIAFRLYRQVWDISIEKSKNGNKVSMKSIFDAAIERGLKEMKKDGTL